MTRTLVVSTLTETELDYAVEWYNSLRPGLGDDLVLCFEQALDRIADHPEVFAMILPEVRRTLVRRFPYGLFFRVREDRIEVEALLPLRSDPARLLDRFASTQVRDS
jgi:plasmid stabilization system protein ParE